MSDQAREHLEELHGHLNEAAASGHDDAAALAGDVGDYLAKGEPASTDHEALLDRLRTGVRRYEVDHPKLSEAVQRVVDSLTASGI